MHSKCPCFFAFYSLTRTPHGSASRQSPSNLAALPSPACFLDEPTVPSLFSTQVRTWPPLWMATFREGPSRLREVVESVRALPR